MILDTSFCVDLLRETSKLQEGPASRKLASLKETDIFLSMFTVCELQAGAQLSRFPEKELIKIEKFISFTQILYPDSSFPILFGQTEAYLRKSGTPVPVMDLLIAVTCKAAGLPLLTRDSRHFSLIPALSVESY